MLRVVCRVALLALSVCGWCVSAAPPHVLFPKNLHLTRQVSDPVTGSTTTIEEYCYGNRVVSVSGDKTVIADYDKQQITEIDRKAGTYSISRFDEVASVVSAAGESSATDAEPGAKRDRWIATPRGVRGSAAGRSAGRSVEQFEFAEDGASGRRVAVGIDRSIALSEEAVEVLDRCRVPQPASRRARAVVARGRCREARAIASDVQSSADAASAPDAATYGLPVTQAFTYSDSGSEITFRTAVTRIGAEAPPAGCADHPARRKTGRIARLQRYAASCASSTIRLLPRRSNSRRDLDHLEPPPPFPACPAPASRPPGELAGGGGHHQRQPRDPGRRTRGRHAEPPVTTGIDIPTTIQTEFGGKQNDEAPAIEGLLAVGELTGPGIERRSGSRPRPATSSRSRASAAKASTSSRTSA